MDIHEEIYRNKTPDAINLDGKTTPDSGIDVASFLDKDVETEKPRPETILEESEGERGSARSTATKSGLREDEQKTQHTDDEGIGDIQPDLKKDELPKIITPDKQHQNKHEEDQKQEEEEEEEPEPPAMTFEEKEEMHRAVKLGYIDLLDDLMDKPGANIHFDWFKENLLMAAIRHDQLEMAEFLIDNGIDFNYQTTKVEITKKTPITCMDWYTMTCRQCAYECQMLEIVELIDELNGNSWPFLKPREREIRMKRSLEEKLRERGEWVSSGEEAEDGDDEGSSIVSINGTRMRRKRKKRGDGEDEIMTSKSTSSKGTAVVIPHIDESDSQEKPTEDSGLPPDASGSVALPGANSPGEHADHVSSGYDTLSAISSVRDMSLLDELIESAPKPKPGRHALTKTALTRVRMGQAHSKLPDHPSRVKELLEVPGSYHTERRLWTPPVGSTRWAPRPPSPFTKRHKSHTAVGLPPSSQTHRDDSQRKKRIYSAPNLPVDTAAPSLISSATSSSFSPKPPRAKPQYLDKTIRRESTLLNVTTRGTSRSTLRPEITARLNATADAGARRSIVNQKAQRPFTSRIQGHNAPSSSESAWNKPTIFRSQDAKTLDKSANTSWIDRLSQPKTKYRCNRNAFSYPAAQSKRHGYTQAVADLTPSFNPAPPSRKPLSRQYFTMAQALR